jgi:HEAT repeat protein
MVQVLGTLDERIPLDHLLPLLSDPDPDVRQTVIEALKKRRGHISIDLLQPFFYGTNEGTWQAAVEVLEVLDEQILPDLLKDLLIYPDNAVRQVALRIAKKQNSSILSDLIQHAHTILEHNKVSGDIFIRLSQISFLTDIVDSGIPSASLLKLLTTLLDEPYWLVQKLAADALGQIRRNIPDQTIRRLLELRREPGPKMHAVREAADDALAEILSLETGIEDD